ncbi:MAG: prenyltransferase/squalene oxidase repeat-containing protein [Bacillota bacterium]
MVRKMSFFLTKLWQRKDKPSVNTDVIDDSLQSIFLSEIRSAIKWLLDIQDSQTGGWGWIQHIPPNEQNTAEVVYALLLFLQEDLYRKDESRFLVEKRIQYIARGIVHFLIKVEEHAKLSIDWIWVLRALLQLKTYWNRTPDYDPIKNSLNDALEKELEKECYTGYQAEQAIDAAIANCIQWLLKNQGDQGAWSDTETGPPNIIRTAFTIYTIADGGRALGERFAEVKPVIERAAYWLVQVQRKDGGWGCIPEPYNTATFPPIQLPEIDDQENSNPAATAYALLALGALNPQVFKKSIRRGMQWLINNRDRNTGGWPVFREVGIRNGNVFTFRHFSTAWTLAALLKVNPDIILSTDTHEALQYLLTLQDPYAGGWRTSSDADPTTWASVNAVETLLSLENTFHNIGGLRFSKLVAEWRKMKMEKEVEVIKLLGIPFAFNYPMSILFSSFFTAVLFSIVGGVMFFDWSKLVRSILCSGLTIIASIPWIVHFVKFKFNEWSSALQLVGLFIGFILAVILGLIALL